MSDRLLASQPRCSAASLLEQAHQRLQTSGRWHGRSSEGERLSFWDMLSAQLLPSQALEQSVEALKAMLTDLRLDVAAKDAELVIIKAEGESFRRQLIPRAQNTLSADTEVTVSGRM